MFDLQGICYMDVVGELMVNCKHKHIILIYVNLFLSYLLVDAK